MSAREEELRRILGKPSNPNTSKRSMNELRSILGKAPKKESPDEFTFGERALQFGRGAAKDIGGLADVVSKHVLAPMTKASGFIAENFPLPTSEPERRPEEIQQLNKQAYERLSNPVAEETLTKPFDIAAGRSLEPTESDTLGKVLQTAGGFAVPIPGTGYVKAGKMGSKALGKVVGREAATSLGAAAALEAKPKFTDEGGIGRGIENFADAILGSRAGHALSGKSAKISENLYKTTKDGKWGQTLKEAPLKGAARFVSKFSNPDEKALRLAKGYDIDLPVNVGVRNSFLNFLHNNFMKSTFSSKAYKDVFNNANEQMFNKLKQSIDTLGLENIEPSEASKNFKSFLSEESKNINSTVEQLYSDAVLKSGKSDMVIPKNTIEDVHKFKSLLDRDVQAPDTKKVSKIIGELMDSWGILPKNEISQQLKKQGYDDPRLLSQILENIPKNSHDLPNIEIGRLNEVRQELGKMIYDKDLRGAEKLLGSLRQSVTKDIESSANPEFVKKWKGANKFYRDNVAQRVESDLARSMLTGDAPTEAFNAMKDVQGIELVEKIAGETEKGRKVLADLKKAKLRDIFKNAIEGSFDEGTIRHAPFAKIFQKGEKTQEVIKKLLPKEEYSKLADLSKISEEFSAAGKELLNTSGTAMAAADIDRVQSFAKNALKVLFVGGGYSLAGTLGALGGVGADMATPYLLSRLVSNPVFVRESRIYALARKAGKEKQAKTTLNKLFKISESEARKSAQTLLKMAEEEPEE